MGSVSETSPIITIGKSDGLFLWNDGGLGIPGGSSGMAPAMAVSPSTAAPSVWRLGADCSGVPLGPRALTQLLSSGAGVGLNRRLRGGPTAPAQAAGPRRRTRR